MVRALLIVIFVVLAWFAVSYLAAVLAPILAALGIAYLLNPVLDRFVRRTGIYRTVGAAIILVGFVAVIAGALAFSAPRVAKQLTQFFSDVPRMVDNLNVWLRSHFHTEIPAHWTQYISADALPDSAGPLRELATAALGGIFQLLGVVAELLLVPVFSFYFLVDWPNFTRRVEHMIPPRRRRETREVLHEIDDVVAGWVRGQTIVTTVLATLYATGFTIVGMPLALPIGLLVGALTLIPFVGALLGATIAAVVTIADGGNAQTLALVAVVILCLHLLEAGFLTPKIIGHRVGLSESGALFAVVAGGKLLGFVGVVLAVPIAATCAVLMRYAVRYYEHTAFFGRESDTDVVITPAMAIIMPGIAPGAQVAHDLPAVPQRSGDVPVEATTSAPPPQDDSWTEPELGAAGAPDPQLPDNRGSGDS